MIPFVEEAHPQGMAGLAHGTGAESALEGGDLTYEGKLPPFLVISSPRP